MPNKKTIRRAQKNHRSGKAPTTQAGQFVRDEIRKIRKGEHGARSPQQAIAIGLSETRRAGVKLPLPPGKKTKSAADSNGKRKQSKASPTRSKATLKALRREPTSTVSKENLSRQAKQSAAKRGPYQRHKAALKAVKTKGQTGLRRAAKKAAHTRELEANK